MMNKVHLTTFHIRARPVDVTVTENGRFHAEVDGRSFSAENLDALRESLMTATRVAATKVAVEATLLRSTQFGHKTQPIVLTGIHSKDGVVLYRDASGKAQRLDNYRMREFIVRRLTSEEVEEYEQLLAASAEAEKALDAFTSRVKIDVIKTVKEAISEASGVPVEKVR